MDIINIGVKNQPFFELSPYYFCTFIVYGKKWRTLIHYWTAMYFKEDFMTDFIRNQDTPYIALNIAKHKGFKDFNQIDKKKFLYGIQERFNQNDSLRSILLSTGSSQIIYGTGHDYLSQDNRYGRILMRIREVYQE